MTFPSFEAYWKSIYVAFWIIYTLGRGWEFEWISGSDFAIPSLQLLKVCQVEGKKTSNTTTHHPPPPPPATTHHYPPPPPTTTHHHHPPLPTTTHHPPPPTTHHHPPRPPSTCFSFALLHHVVGLLSLQLRAEWQLAPAAYQAFQVI